MKIKLEVNDIEVSLKTDCPHASKSDVLAITGALYDATIQFAKVDNAKEPTIEKVAKQISQSTKMTPVIHSEDRPMVRDRLPNNIVDIKDLTVEQAVTENALVRCPNCGQAHALVVMDNGYCFFMRRDYDKNEFVIIGQYNAVTDKKEFLNVCCKEDTDRNLYFDDLQKISESTTDNFSVTNDTELFCPVCNTSNTFVNWKKAFDMPLDFFETEQLCDACGGEVVTKMVKKKKMCQCEKCGHTTEYKGE